jgi:hypothetical protein
VRNISSDKRGRERSDVKKVSLRKSGSLALGIKEMTKISVNVYFLIGNKHRVVY